MASSLRHVLAVDDDPEVLDSLGGLCAGLGHRLERARSGPEALRKLDWRSFDVVLADYKMPGMDGYAFAKAARSRHPTLPIVLMTGAAQCRTSPDITYFMYKPFCLDELKSLLAVLECLVHRPRTKRPGQASQQVIGQLLTRALQSLANDRDAVTRARALEQLRLIGNRRAKERGSEDEGANQSR